MLSPQHSTLAGGSSPSTSCAACWEPWELAAPPLPAVPGIWSRGPGRPGQVTIPRFHRTLSLTQCLGIFLLVLSRLSERAWGLVISLVGHCVLKMATQLPLKWGGGKISCFKNFWHGPRVKPHRMVARQHVEDQVWLGGPAGPGCLQGPMKEKSLGSDGRGGPHFLISKVPPFHRSCLVNARKVFAVNISGAFSGAGQAGSACRCSKGTSKPENESITAPTGCAGAPLARGPPAPPRGE